MTKETCVAWDPIPDAVNEFWNVDVVQLEESTPPNDVGGLALIVASQWKPLDQETALACKAWRVRFLGYRAYRMRTVGYYETKPLTRPNQRKATWEILSSMYLCEEGAPNGMDPGLLDSTVLYHHYVILTGGNIVYEIIGGKWTCEPVGDEWAHPFQQAPQ